jgi:glutamine synthetase type III
VSLKNKDMEKSEGEELKERGLKNLQEAVKALRKCYDKRSDELFEEAVSAVILTSHTLGLIEAHTGIKTIEEE